MRKKNTESKPESMVDSGKKLEEACDRARTLLASADRADLGARYKLAAIIREVKDSAEYGASGVERMEGALNLRRATLYRLAKVAEVWNEHEFQEMAGRETKNGLALSWSHLELIAQVKDGSSRKRFLERVFELGLNVRDLRAKINASKRSGPMPQAKSGPALTVGRLAKHLAYVETDAAALFESMLEDQGLDGLNPLDPRIKGAAETLQRVEPVLANLRVRLERALARRESGTGPGAHETVRSGLSPAASAAP